MSDDIVRVLRIIEYVGPRRIVEDTVRRSIHGTITCGGEGAMRITAVTLHDFPEQLEKARHTPMTDAQMRAAGRQPPGETDLDKPSRVRRGRFDEIPTIPNHHCTVCKQRVFETEGGAVCLNGHGGAEEVGEPALNGDDNAQG